MPFLKKSAISLVVIDHFSIIDADRDECSVSFHEIDNETTSAHKAILKLELSKLNGLFFEEGKIYLLNRHRNFMQNGRLPALNIHPFLIHGNCNTCTNETIFIWNNFHRDDRGCFSLDYGCVTCGALKSDVITSDGRIGSFYKTELDNKFDQIMKILFKDYCNIH